MNTIGESCSHHVLIPPFCFLVKAQPQGTPKGTFYPLHLCQLSQWHFQELSGDARCSLFHCVGRNSLLQFTDKRFVWDNLQACRCRVSQRSAFRDTTREPRRRLHLPILSMNVGIHANHADHMKAWLSLNMNLNKSWTLIYQPLHSYCVPNTELQWWWEASERCWDEVHEAAGKTESVVKMCITGRNGSTIGREWLRNFLSDSQGLMGWPWKYDKEPGGGSLNTGK